MDRLPNARIRELCGVKKGLDERIDEGGGSAICRGLRGIGLPRESMQENVLVVIQWVGHRRDGLIP